MVNKTRFFYDLVFFIMIIFPILVLIILNALEVGVLALGTTLLCYLVSVFFMFLFTVMVIILAIKKIDKPSDLTAIIIGCLVVPVIAPSGFYWFRLRKKLKESRQNGSY